MSTTDSKDSKLSFLSPGSGNGDNGGVTNNVFDNSGASNNVYDNSGASNNYDSSSESPRRLFCVVCGAQARGYNFGVTACESCKAFFRRNALRREVRPCCHGGTCPIQEENRKSCPACRIKKCFEVGMKKELIHPPERLMMRAKPKSWSHSRRSPSANHSSHMASGSSAEARNMSICSSTSTMTNNADPVKQEIFDDRLKDMYLNVAGPSALAQTATGQLPSTADHQEVFSDDPFGSNISLIPKVGRTRCTETGITCCPLTDIDDGYYYLSSKFHFILGMAKGPFMFNPKENCVTVSANPNSAEDGFSMYEYVIKRMVSTLVHLPHFNKIDKSIFIDIVKEKLFGAAQIFSCLYFNDKCESWQLQMTLPSGVVKEESVECAPFFYNTFRCLTKPSGMSSTAVLKMGDIDNIFKANMNSSKRICEFSKNNGVFIIALLGYYLTIDEGFLQHSVGDTLLELRKIYERFLMQMHNVISGSCDICSVYQEIITIMQIVKWIEVRYVDLGKYLQNDKLPPLLKEIFINGEEPK